MAGAGEFQIRDTIDILVKRIHARLCEHAEVVILPVLRQLEIGVGLGVILIQVLVKIAAHKFVGLVLQHGGGGEVAASQAMAPLHQVPFTINGQAA